MQTDSHIKKNQQEPNTYTILTQNCVFRHDMHNIRPRTYLLQEIKILHQN